ncbi:MULTISPECIES: ABC transporter ATP-binding protein [Kocuria]|uniref:Nitrate ABC transporter ATP-binding protein n=1 Tax=Kocuria flava TaxID=446860 RepID=A0ABQ0X376_9MICC|nr:MULTISPECIES: ATP-binding cassette domain-containing protein [Kocuria]MCD1145176.1 ATP-binding cassette domain-containing protein [Kocuria sp. LUK]GEO92088.1 nitrate ABC transporter ATP-binding protein [Kocuria flava]
MGTAPARLSPDRPALRVRGVHKTYPGAAAPALDGVDLTLHPGETLAVLGPSGSGKSTLLRAIAGLEPLDRGTVEFGDPDERLAVVFQDPGLFPWLSVRANIALGGRYRRNRDRFDEAHVDELLGILGLAELARTPVQELSGGQAQRVSVGRALAVRPDVLLLDEPFSALDPATRQDLQQWLRGLVRELSLTVFLVTHDVEEALVLGDRIGFFGGPAGFTRQWVPARDGATAEQILAHYRGTDAAGGAWEI